MKKIILAAAAFVAFAVNANAQTSATQTVNLNLSDAIELTFVGSGSITGTAVGLPFTTVSNYADGVTSAAQQLKVRSNKNFKIDVKANSANFSYSGTTTPAPTMPVASVLGIEVAANATGGSIVTPFTTSTYAAVSSTTQPLLNGCTNGSNQTFSVQYKATPGFAYPAGTYSVDVVYTATQL